MDTVPINLREMIMVKGKPQIHGEITPFGFEYGAATITRIHGDVANGWVVMSLKTPKTDLQIYVTKTGLVKIHDAAGNKLA